MTGSCAPDPTGGPDRGAIRAVRHVAVTAICVATLAGALAAIIHLRVIGRPGTPQFAPVLFWQVLVWAPWIPLLFIVRHLAMHPRLQRFGRPGWLAWHSAGSVLMATLHLAWYFLVSNLASPYRGLPGTKYGAFAWFFIFWFLLDLFLYWTILAFARGNMLASDSTQLAGRINALEQALAERRPPDAQRLFEVRKNGQRHVIAADEVRWIEAQDYYAALHTSSGTFLLRESLASLAERLDENRFVRLHRSTIANVNFVRELDVAGGGTWHVTLSDGTRRRVSRAGRRVLRRHLKGGA